MSAEYGMRECRKVVSSMQVVAAATENARAILICYIWRFATLHISISIFSKASRLEEAMNSVAVSPSLLPTNTLWPCNVCFVFL